ncbi:unnamed protein product [Rotaria socialis]|uniref:Uncharacterized protein n=2 Tax=Rotaria socialis TaxID=392032 RepID=A0A818CT16_9BILA|nr:unnamed protein product [Rotaria socialis]CAF3557330.1 unnamed protein product [Rotaria socialis]
MYEINEDKNEDDKVLISLMYSNETSNFHVKIQGICHLLPLAIDRQSDLHCELCLIPYDDLFNKSIFKRQVKTKKKKD